MRCEKLCIQPYLRILLLIVVFEKSEGPEHTELGAFRFDLYFLFLDMLGVCTA